jgi:hypothetical protein
MLHMHVPQSCWQSPKQDKGLYVKKVQQYSKSPVIFMGVNLAPQFAEID